MVPSSARLSMHYRMGYRLRLALLTILGPADLEESSDPKARLRRERARREAVARGDDHSA